MRSSIDEASATALLRAADSAMYRAKQDGRGCVRVDPRQSTTDRHVH